MKRLFLISAASLGLLFSDSASGGVSEKGASDGKASIQSVDSAGIRHTVKGYVPMKAAPGSKTFAAAPSIKEIKLPRTVDLRSKMTKVEDQGRTSSCVANAVAGAYEYWTRLALNQDYDVSRLFIYYNARWRNGDQDKDEGSYIQFAMQGLKEFGACPEKAWPFEKPLLLKKPNGDAYEQASQVKVKEMQQVPLELEAWKQALASGYPIVFGCRLFDSFDECTRRGGVVPMPNPKDLARSSHGGHAMCAVGYSEKEQVFIVRNSWGDKWGDKGYCYMPYNYMMNPEFNFGDSWVFIPETPVIPPEDTWSDDDKPVIDDGRGVNFVINPYTIEDYEEVEVPWQDEVIVEYNETVPEQYVEYVEYSESDNWEAMEQFEYEEVIETWEAENPGEETDLDVYDESEVEDNADAEESDEEVAEEEEENVEEEVADDADEGDEGVIEEESDADTDDAEVEDNADAEESDEEVAEEESAEEEVADDADEGVIEEESDADTDDAEVEDNADAEESDEEVAEEESAEEEVADDADDADEGDEGVIEEESDADTDDAEVEDDADAEESDEEVAEEESVEEEVADEGGDEEPAESDAGDEGGDAGDEGGDAGGGDEE